MFRFAEAQVLHDETSWSARGTRRRRPARPSSGSQICRMQSAPEALVVQPTDFVRRGEAASETPKDCAAREAAFARYQEPPRGPGRASTKSATPSPPRSPAGRAAPPDTRPK